jgi:methionine biosynthesis protein MetW
MATSGDTPAPRARASGDRKQRVKRYDTTGSRTIDELDPNSSYAKAYALIPAGSRVLDLGCGSGELASYLAARGDRVWGVDINPTALAQAAASCVETRVADLERADVAGLFPGLLFDVVVFADVLEHVREPWNVLQSARTVLDSGGCVVASIPNFGHAAVRLAVVSGAMPYRGLGILDGTHVRFFTRNGVTSLFEESGFRVQAIDRTTLAFDQPSDLVPDVRMLRVPGDIERHVREDPENETLQFVVRAIMLPGEWDIDALRDRLHDVEAHAEEQAVGMRNLLHEHAAALALVREREAQVSALEHAAESAAAGVRAQLVATAAERDELVVARAQESAARQALEAELAEARTALREANATAERALREANATAERALREANATAERALREATEVNEAALQRAVEQRDDARALAEEARAQLQSREHALGHELEGSRREIAELRDVLAAARERTPALIERCALLEAAVADAERRAAVLQDADERGSRREAHAAEVIAAAEADRAALKAALARADTTLATVVEQRDEHAQARAALARYAAEAEATEAALRAALQTATDELELLRRRARHEALAWMAREHAERGEQEAGAQFWPDGLATR